MINFFNNLNEIEYFSSLSSEEINIIFIYLWLYFLVFAGNFLYYFIFFIKFYRILCFSKITFDGLPMINPYIWPFSIFRVLTQPYFQFWSKLLPTFKSGKSSFDISLILGLEALSALIFILTQIRVTALLEAATLLSKMP